jgi:hypothetical protein
MGRGGEGVYVPARFGPPLISPLSSLLRGCCCCCCTDLGGDRAYASMLPIVCVDAVAVSARRKVAAGRWLS